MVQEVTKIHQVKVNWHGESEWITRSHSLWEDSRYGYHTLFQVCYRWIILINFNIIYTID